MNTETLKRWLTSVGLLALIGALWLAGYASLNRGKDQPQPASSSNGAASGYPVLGDATPISILPTVLGSTPQRFEGVKVTPLPDEKVQIGALIELGTAPSDVLARYAPHSRYTAKVIYPFGELVSKSYIVVIEKQSGKEIARLGNESSHAILEGMNDEYVIWSCAKCPSLPFGSYVYRLTTGEQSVILEGNRTQYPKIDGEWVVYISNFAPSAELYAYNLNTGEDVLITQDMTTRGSSFQGSASEGDFFAFRGGKVVWATDLSAKKNYPLYWGLSMYDLAKRTRHELHLPESLGNFRRLDIFGDLVIWQQYFWQGYDLKRDAYFSIPVIPPGWENVPHENIIEVVASEGQLYWMLKVNGKEHYFRAPVVPREPRPSPPHLVPTPVGLPPITPTVIAPVPTAAPPTPYP